MSRSLPDANFAAALIEMRDSVLLTDEPVSVHMKNAIGEMPIHVFAVRGDMESLKRCVELGSDVNAPGEHGFTPLHEAAMHGHPELLQWLLDVGADPLAKNDWGETPIETALSLGDQAHTKVLKILGAA